MVNAQKSAASTTLAGSHPLSPSPSSIRAVRKAASSDATQSDGRRARGERNRKAVVDAILGLLEEGVTSPTAQEIADRAGVSLRSVFRHFDDLDALFLAAIERQAKLTSALYVPPSKDGTLDDRIKALMVCRRRLYERIFSVRRGWMLRYYDHPRVANILDEVYRGLHHQIEVLFDQDMATLSRRERRDLVDAIDVLASFDTWAHMRAHRSIGSTRAALLIQTMIAAQFDQARVNDPPPDLA